MKSNATPFINARLFSRAYAAAGHAGMGGHAESTRASEPLHGETGALPPTT
jgi:hypothetical protein